MQTLYVRICIDHNTCCCRYHVEFHFFYDKYVLIHYVFHPNIFWYCSYILPPIPFNTFIHNIMCPRHNMQTYYVKPCLCGTYSRCSGFSLLRWCNHESKEYELGRMIVNMNSLKYVTNGLNSRKKAKGLRSEVLGKLRYIYIFLIHLQI